MYAYVGGLLGFMPPDGSDKDTSTQVNIKALTFDGFSITASNAQTACGEMCIRDRFRDIFFSSNSWTMYTDIKNG